MSRRRGAVAAGVAATASALLAAPTGAVPAAFGDVEPDAWYGEAVEWLVGEELTTGVSTGCFDPDAALTRGQAAVFLHRVADTPDTDAPLPFVDVTLDWQIDAVRWLAAEGITSGVAPLRFAPHAPVTRGQFAVLLHRFAGRPPAPDHRFTDVRAPWQHDAVSWLASEGITTGTGPGRFSPDAVVTRAQLASFLHRHAGEPSPTPVNEPAPPPTCRHPLVVHGTGDVNLAPGYGPQPEHPFAYAWSGLEGLFVLDDLTIVNLECAPTAIGEPVPKEFNFRCPVDALGPARDAGVDVANLANNHAGDYGVAAMLDGAANVAAAGIRPVGVGSDLAGATTPALIEENGWTIAVLGFNTLGSNLGWYAGPERPGMAPGDVDTLSAAVRAADAVADLVFVTIHWGIEESLRPAADDLPRARALIDAGADAVFGHHSHRLQPLEFHDGRPIFWSLGNLVWQSSERSRTTAIGRVDVAVDGTITASLVPADIAERGHPVLVR